MSHVPLRLGTRRSPLALAQARMAAVALEQAHGWAAGSVALVPIVAAGDMVQDRALSDIGGKALWTRELDSMLADRTIDAAVHSMKDVETIRPPHLTIAAMLPRADVRDRLIGAASIAALPPGARIGTASPRRRAQLLALRPDLAITLLRGNVGTRLDRVRAGAVDATLLAAAGLDRLGMGGVGNAVAIDMLLPAPAQGAVGLETRTDDGHARALLAVIDDVPTHGCVAIERAILAALDADCHAPVGALAQVADDGFDVRLQLLAEDGRAAIADRRIVADTASAAAFARDLLARAPQAVARRFGS